MKPIICVLDWLVVDAERAHEEHPSTFEVPTPAAISMLRLGDHIKVSIQSAKLNLAERFWCEILSLDTPWMRVQAENDLKYTEHHGIRDMSILLIQRCNIIGMYIHGPAPTKADDVPMVPSGLVHPKCNRAYTYSHPYQPPS